MSLSAHRSQSIASSACVIIRGDGSCRNLACLDGACRNLCSRDRTIGDLGFNQRARDLSRSDGLDLCVVELAFDLTGCKT